MKLQAPGGLDGQAFGGFSLCAAELQCFDVSNDVLNLSRIEHILERRH